MNDEQTAYAICRELDLGTSQLDDDLTKRLQAARASALREYRAPDRASTMQQSRLMPRASTLTDQPSRLMRLLIAGVPAMMLVIGLIGVHQWGEERRIEQLAELDAEVLLDEVPLAAYADEGFGVYLKNTREWTAVPAFHVATSTTGR